MNHMTLLRTKWCFTPILAEVVVDFFPIPRGKCSKNPIRLKIPAFLGSEKKFKNKKVSKNERKIIQTICLKFE